MSLAYSLPGRLLAPRVAYQRTLRFVRAHAIGLALAASVVGLFLLRFLVLSQSPYPPSSDAGGDLYGLHAWLGTAPSAGAQFPALPPVYSFAVVLPATSLLPVFTGVEVYMALVPALLVPAGYVYFRRSEMRPWACLVGAVLLGGSALYSLMITWNAAYNLFSILLLVLFLASLNDAFRKGGKLRILLCGGVFGAIAGSHELTLLVALVVLAVTATSAIIVERGSLRRRARRPILVAAACLAFALPFAGLYLGLLGGGANVGIAGYSGTLLPVYRAALPFAWGAQPGPIPAVVWVDMLLAAGGLLLWGLRPKDHPIYVATLGGVFFAALLVPLLSASEGIRGLYYLPIPLSAAAASLLDQAVGADGRLRLDLLRPRRSTPERAPELSPARGRGRWCRYGPALSAAVVIALVGANVSYSAATTTTGANFYRVLDPNRVAALDWARSETPANATFYDGAGLSAWMWGYAGRADYSPQPLFAQSTAASLAAATLADEIDLGAYVVGDGVLAVGENPPGASGTPTLYATTPGGWLPVATSQPSLQRFWVTNATGAPFALDLSDAQLAFANASGATIAGAAYHFGFWWPGLDLGVQESLAVSGSGIWVNWSSNDSTFRSAEWGFALPPSGYFFDYGLPDGQGSRLLVALAFPSVGSMEFSLYGGDLQWSLAANGWTNVEFNGSALEVGMGGLSVPPAHPYALDTSRLFGTLHIGFAVVDYSQDYGMFTRLGAGVPGELQGIRIAQFGGIFLFRVAMG